VHTLGMFTRCGFYRGEGLFFNKRSIRQRIRRKRKKIELDANATRWPDNEGHEMNRRQAIVKTIIRRFGGRGRREKKRNKEGTIIHESIETGEREEEKALQPART